MPGDPYPPVRGARPGDRRHEVDRDSRRWVMRDIERIPSAAATKRIICRDPAGDGLRGDRVEQASGLLRFERHAADREIIGQLSHRFLGCEQGLEAAKRGFTRIARHSLHPVVANALGDSSSVSRCLSDYRRIPALRVRHIGRVEPD